jgi:hypothetical protein
MRKGETAVAASPSWSNGLQILGGRLAGLAVHHNLERDTLTFSELTQAGAFNGADMDEHILAAAFGLDESITLLRVEPFHCSVAHGTLLCRNHDLSRARGTARFLEILVKDRQSGALIVAAWPSRSAENSIGHI